MEIITIRTRESASTHKRMKSVFNTAMGLRKLKSTLRAVLMWINLTIGTRAAGTPTTLAMYFWFLADRRKPVIFSQAFF